MMSIFKISKFQRTEEEFKNFKITICDLKESTRFIILLQNEKASGVNR